MEKMQLYPIWKHNIKPEYSFQQIEPTGKSSDVLNIQWHFFKNALEYSTLLLIDSMGLFCGTILTIRSKMGMIQQNDNVTDRVNYRADAKRF